MHVAELSCLLNQVFAKQVLFANDVALLFTVTTIAVFVFFVELRNLVAIANLRVSTVLLAPIGARLTVLTA